MFKFPEDTDAFSYGWSFSASFRYAEEEGKPRTKLEYYA